MSFFEKVNITFLLKVKYFFISFFKMPRSLKIQKLIDSYYGFLLYVTVW